jgi:hypothetical protein
MSLRILLLLLFSLGASATVLAAGSKAARAPDYAATDRAVLAASLQFTCDQLNEHNRGSFEVLESQSAQVRKLSADLQEEYAEALRNLLERNIARQSLPSGIACNAIKVVDPQTIDAAFNTEKKPPSWDNFYAQYPGAAGRGSISLPGYSRKRDHAVVYRAGACGPMCANGVLQLMRKVGKAWQLEESVTIWIS